MAHHCNVCTFPIDPGVHQEVLQRVKDSTREKRARDVVLLKLIESGEVLPTDASS